MVLEDTRQGRVRFDGILEGESRDASGLRALVEALNREQPLTFHLDFDGPRFSLLPDESGPAGVTIDEAAQERVVGYLRRLVEDEHLAGSVESTLRCSERRGGTVRETLFPVLNGKLNPVSRERSVDERDRPTGDGAETDDPRSHRRDRWPAIVVCILVVVVGGLIAYQQGLVDRLFGPRVEDLAVERRAFDGLLDLEVQGSWRGLEVKLRRGPDYPETTADLAALRSGAATTRRLAAIDIVGEGGDVYLRLEDGEGRVLAVAKVELRRLLAAEDAAVAVSLPIRLTATRLALAFDAGTPDG